MALKMAARKQTLKDLLAAGTTNVDELAQECVGDITPPHSDISSLSPPHSDNSLPPSPDVYSSNMKDDSDDESIGITRGMLDHSRMAICMFMFAVMAFNPFGIALNNLAGTNMAFATGSRRSTLSVDSKFNYLDFYCSSKLNLLNILAEDTGTWTWFSSSIFLWIFNLIVLFICLIKMLVYGDPIMPSKSKESQNFWRYRRQADFYLSKVRNYGIIYKGNEFWEY